MAEARISILIADDHPMVREGLRAFLETQDDFAVVGEAGNGAEAVSFAERLIPDVILMDLVMPGMDGISAIREVRRRVPASRIIVLTSFAKDELIFPAIQAGAEGYLLKDIASADLAAAIRTVHKGDPILHPDIARRLMSAVGVMNRDPDAQQLTDREWEVLRLLGERLSNREIAERLVISEKTVKTHVGNILSKLHLSDRTAAARYAHDAGLLGEGSGRGPGR
ncbi:MAG: response regulator [Chloroflexota bacterium]